MKLYQGWHWNRDFYWQTPKCSAFTKLERLPLGQYHILYSAPPGGVWVIFSRVIDCRKKIRRPGYGIRDSNSCGRRSCKHMQILIPWRQHVSNLFKADQGGSDRSLSLWYREEYLYVLPPWHFSTYMGWETIQVPDRNQYCMIPYNVAPNYTSREEVEKRLSNSCLPPQSPTAINRCHVLYGVGGSGKTQVCLKFAQDHRNA